MSDKFIVKVAFHNYPLFVRCKINTLIILYF
nr:MAG TPA: hypothetical protein [Caudoviricetes sp.]DAS95264.1 MAG TPA: hypothetical protein [Caudoviricetes sp.]